MFKASLFNLLTVGTVGTSSIAGGVYYTTQNMSIDVSVPMMSIGTAKGEVVGEFFDVDQILNIKATSLRDVFTNAGSIGDGSNLISNGGTIGSQGSDEFPHASKYIVAKQATLMEM